MLDGDLGCRSREGRRLESLNGAGWVLDRDGYAGGAESAVATVVA